MFARREIKKQRFKCWSDQFITNLTNLNKGKGRMDTIMDWGNGKGKPSDRKDR